MTDRDPALTQALDHLALQVNRDNVLAVCKVFHDFADELDTCLRSLSQTTAIGQCGGDPVSRIAASEASFGGKVNALLEVHRAHQRELVIATDHLRNIALSYGHTEGEIERLLSPEGPS